MLVNKGLSVFLLSIGLLYPTMAGPTLPTRIGPLFPTLVGPLFPTLTEDAYPITEVGIFFAAVISLVGIGIIAVPTGIIAAGFSQVISRERKEKQDDSGKQLLVEDLEEEELLALQARIVKKLNDDGYYDKNTNVI